MKIALTQLQYLNVHFSILSPNFFLSFDLSLSCKLQLIDHGFAACLAGWQTILVCFFPENCGFIGKEKKQMDGKLKTQLDAF